MAAPNVKASPIAAESRVLFREPQLPSICCWNASIPPSAKDDLPNCPADWIRAALRILSIAVFSIALGTELDFKPRELAIDLPFKAPAVIAAPA